MDLPPPIVLTTARLIAESLAPAHRDAIHAMHQDPLAMAELGGIRDEAATRAYIEFNAEHWRRYGFGLWMLRLRSDGSMVGRLILRHFQLDDADEVELGYSLTPACWGKGLAAEAATAACEYAVKELRLASLVALIRPTNHRSIRLAHRLGFALEREIAHADAIHQVYRRRFD